MSKHAFLGVIYRDDTNKCAVLRVGTLTGGPLCREVVSTLGHFGPGLLRPNLESRFALKLKF